MLAWTILSHAENCCLMVESSPLRAGNLLRLDPPGLLGYAVPPSGILKLPVYRTPLISAAMVAVGALFVAVFVCKFACAFRVCSAGVARVYFGFGCDHSAPATMIKRRLSKSERECD